MRNILIILSIVAVNINTCMAQDYKFYALSNDINNDRPVYFCKLDKETGTISIIDRYSGVYKGNYFALSNNNKHLLVTTKSKDDTKGGIVQYNIDEDGSLTWEKEELTAGDLPCHVSFSPDMSYVMSANYADDEISLYNFNNEALSPEIDNISMADQSKGHYISTDPSGKFVHAVFLGLNRVYNYMIESGKYIKNPNQEYFSVSEGYGPRHMVFHPNNKAVFILNETQSSVTACNYDSTTGEIAEIHNISMIPDDFTGTTNAAAIRIHPSGKFLYASNRGHNSIAVYEISENGSLSLVELETSGINFPRDFNLSPDGLFLVAANQKGGTIISFFINQSTGELEPTTKLQFINQPLAIQFLPIVDKDTTNMSSFYDVSDPVNIYPNPADDILTIDSGDQDGICNVSVFNTSGQLVKRVSGENIKTIQVSDLKYGNHILIANMKSGKTRQSIFTKKHH